MLIRIGRIQSKLKCHFASEISLSNRNRSNTKSTVTLLLRKAPNLCQAPGAKPVQPRSPDLQVD